MRRVPFLLALLGACGDHLPEPQVVAFDTASWRADVDAYFLTRADWLPSAYGPVVQTGLCRLAEERLPAMLGADSANACVIAGNHAPPRLGVLRSRGDTLVLEGEARLFWVGPKALRDARALALRDQPAVDGATAWHGPLRLVARWDGPAITVWISDTLTPARAEFAGIERWPLDPAWRFDATFVPADDEWRQVETVRGFELPRQVAGRLVIRHGGEARQLVAYAKGRSARSMLVVIRDGTSGSGSYPAGRFVDVPLPDSTGKTVVDLNLARNPDCAFTAFSPCPLPPRENWFTEPLEVGEKWYRKDG